MSDNSPILALPYIQPAQAQKHVTHNEGMRILDAVAQLSVVSVTDTSPPVVPTRGVRFVVGPVGLGDWASQAGSVAVFDGAGWSFLAPVLGWITWVEDENALRIFDGSDWVAVPGLGRAGDMLGINTSADMINRLAVSSPATLLTHEGAGHQVKINKAAVADTASLLFQTDWSGRAEMGTTGTDDFELKVSADGATFYTALRANGAEGHVTFPQGAQSTVMPQSSPYSVTTQAEVFGYTSTLVRNGFGTLGSTVNVPQGMVWDANTAPDLPASLVCTGYYPGRVALPEAVPVNPNQTYQLNCYVRQEGAPGDWSAFPNEDRHDHYMGLICLDRDGFQIDPNMHMRYRDGTTDSLTTLAAPLQPGDTQIQLVDAAGWNDSNNNSMRRGVIVFGYKDSLGRAYDRYSRIVDVGLFDTTDVNKTTNIIILNQPFPAALGNPDDVNGAWPAGTSLANSTSSADKYSFFRALVAPQTDRWYQSTSYIGGVDRSGTDLDENFAPGTAAIQIFWLPSQTNRAGGYNGSPDTGNAQRVWFAGIQVQTAPLARLEPVMIAGEEGAFKIKIPTEDANTGALRMEDATATLLAIDASNL
ncbi:MAG: hypothetical protein ACI82I_001080 [Gammaproteobacteria bacterium]|jgi:hypothetical protein